jgi:hypothetical protein
MEPTKPADSEEQAVMDTPVYGDDPGLGEGYSQDDGYGHNQESMLLHQPEGEGTKKEPAHRERRRRGAGIGLGTAGAAGIPSDKGGHTQTGFGDEDRA